jgi:hypothetical protein
MSIQAAVVYNPGLIHLFNSAFPYSEQSEPFWAEINSGTISIDNNFYYNRILLEKNGSRTNKDIARWRYNLNVTLPVSFSNNSYIIQSEYERSESHLKLKSINNSISYLQKYDLYKLNLASPRYFNLLKLGGGLEIQKSEKTDINYYLILHGAWQQFIFEYQFRTFQEKWDFQISNNSGLINFQKIENYNKQQISISYYLDNKLFLNTEYQKISIGNSGYSGAQNKMLLPTGNARVISASAGAEEFLNLTKLSFGFSNKDYSTDGYFYYMDDLFGKLTSNKSLIREFFLIGQDTYSFGELKASFTKGNSELKIFGYMDTYPFSDFWVDFLGLRYHEKLMAGYNYYIINFDFKRNFIKNSFWQLSVGYENIVLDKNSYLTTWMSEILLVRDLKTIKPDFYEQRGFYISPKITIELLPGLILAYTFNQYVPMVKDFGLQIETSESKSDKFTYGGGQHLIQLGFII